ncbi:MAG TPA: extracellular solute-binding protein [Xanthobacteraceae bacterium]|nr:extracellular solute-binding protein [Xanthobacteraceae bacterium]
MPLTRRRLLYRSAVALAAAALAKLGLSGLVRPAAAQGASDSWRHGFSLFGDLKYPADFKRFDYVNPAAPKGGAVRLLGIGTFDNFNIVVAGFKGQLAAGIPRVYEQLTTLALDEVAAAYGLLAESVRRADDFSSATYRLRAGAKWHDGQPVTPDDVVFSFNAFKTHSPFYGAYYRHVVKVEKSGDRDVTFAFDGPGNRELPQIVGELFILPKHWWEAKDQNGKPRDVSTTTLEPPLASGPYRVKTFEPGRTIVYERVKDYWGKDVPARVGSGNFDEIRYIYFRDATVAFEAFKADQLDWRTQDSAQQWVTGYDFPAVAAKRVIKEEFPVRSSGIMQGFAFNTRRDKFKDARVRHAFNFALDFEEINKQLFYGQYERISSYFHGTELAATGLPGPDELALLEPLRDKVPAEVFTTAYGNPVGGNPTAVRNNLRDALRLMREAGYEIREQKLVEVKTGNQLSVELLGEDPSIERINLFYKPELERMGIAVTIRTIDEAQYENRLRSRDFDIIVHNWPESLSPGNEQRSYWGSAAADQPGSQNFIGIKNPAVDALIDRVIFAKSRSELVAATKALDRVLLWNHYVVPQWTYRKVRSARWDRFGRPDTMPQYGADAFPTIWWWDEAKAAKTGSGK